MRMVPSRMAKIYIFVLPPGTSIYVSTMQVFTQRSKRRAKAVPVYRSQT